MNNQKINIIKLNYKKLTNKLIKMNKKINKFNKNKIIINNNK